MDPLSIATGAASLAATASALSLWLYTLIKEIKNADTKLTALSKEVTVLTGLLASVENTIRKCHSQTLTLAHLDEQIWQQLDNVMVDCKITLEGLDRLVDKIRSDSESRNFMRLLKKPSMHFKLTIQKNDISDFMNKIYKLNCALQTALAVVNISLSFRANTSQELMFRELQGLKNLVEEALVASHGTENNADPFAARLTRNLHSLAKAAQKFHSTASSSASTRYEGGGRMSGTSNWSGSDFGRLNDYQRERIERWNDQLQVVEEAQEDNTTTTTEGSPLTDHSTVITTPDLDDKPSKMGERPEADEDESDDDDSDIELDFLKNFDELACTSFARKDYSKSEQFLRKAMERSTGESSSETDFKLLRVRLAICCCLQERWEFAAGALAPLSKSKAASNLPVFHLLQAIALGYLANDRFDDAHNVCKTALQGKKKILGKTSDDFHECLSILASIYEKKGEPLEAEAVRLSIPAGWNARSLDRTGSGKQYVLDHETLIDFAFGKQSAGHAKCPSSSSSASRKDVAKSGHWTTLVLNGSRDGLQQAKKDEKAGAPLGETDTGKEFLVQTTENLIPRRGTGMGILRAIDDEYSDKQIGEFDSGKEVTVDTPENAISSKDKIQVKDSERPKTPNPISSGTKLGLSSDMVPSWPMPEMCKWENLKSPSKSGEKFRQDLGPDWYSTLELVSQISQQNMAHESYSQSVANPNPKDDEDLSQISWRIENAMDVRSPDSLVTGFLAALDSTVFEKGDPATVHWSVGVSLGLGDASFGISRGSASVTLCDTGISYSQDPSFNVPSPSSSDSHDFWIDYPWNFLRMLLIHDEKGESMEKGSLFPAGLIATKCPDWMDNLEATATTTSRLKDLETAIARWVGEITGNDSPWTKISAVAVSVPDIMIRRAGKVLSYRLAANSLFKHAKLLPSSLAIAYSFIKAKAISLERMKAQSHNTGVFVILNCDEVLVECTSYLLMILDNTHVELSPTEAATADLYGSLHSELEFVKIVMHRLTDIMTRFKIKFTKTTIDTMIESCREHFRNQILPFFINDGRNWVVDINIPHRFLNSILEFSNETVLQCFQPSMRSIRKMAIASILQLYDKGYLATHVLLAGQYTTSKFLCNELRAAVIELGMGVMFLESSHCASASTIGTLNYLDDSGLLRPLGHA